MKNFNFKDSFEATEFGKIASKKAIEDLKVLHKIIWKKVNQFQENKDYEGMAEYAFKRQFIAEALKASGIDINNAETKCI